MTSGSGAFDAPQYGDIAGVVGKWGLPPTEAPGTPSTPALSSRTTTSLTLATVAGSGGTPTTYRWRISTNSTVSNQDPMHTSTSPSITITGLDEDTDYWIDVRGENSVGNSAYSGDLATSTLAGTPDTTVDANAGSDVSVESDGSVQIGGTDTITNPVGTTTYLWSRQSGTGGSLSSTTIASPTFNAPTVTSDRDIVWRKMVTNNGVSDTDDVTVLVEAPVLTDNFDQSGTFSDDSVFQDIVSSAFEPSLFVIPGGAMSDGLADYINFFSMQGGNARVRFGTARADLTASVEAGIRITISYGGFTANIVGTGGDITEPYEFIVTGAAATAIENMVNNYTEGDDIDLRFRSPRMRNWRNIEVVESREGSNLFWYMTTEEFQVAIAHLQEEGLSLPYGAIPGSRPGGIVDAVGTSWAQWRPYEWNPPEFLPITPALLQEFGDTDTDASDKPTWQELVGAKERGMLSDARAEYLRLLDEIATARIASLYHPDAARDRNKEWQVRLSGADFADKDVQRLRIIEAYGGFKTEIEAASTLADLAEIEARRDAAGLRPG